VDEVLGWQRVSRTMKIMKWATKIGKPWRFDVQPVGIQPEIGYNLELGHYGSNISTTKNGWFYTST